MYDGWVNLGHKGGDIEEGKEVKAKVITAVWGTEFIILEQFNVFFKCPSAKQLRGKEFCTPNSSNDLFFCIYPSSMGGDASSRVLYNEGHKLPFVTFQITTEQ